MDRFNQLSLRRLRQNSLVRDLVKQVHVSVDQMIQPLFVVENLNKRQAVPGLSGVFRETSESILSTIESDLESGVKKFILFGIPQEKKAHDLCPDFTASQIAEIKKRFGKDIFLAVDVCLCSSTPHGHCGVLNSAETEIDNSSSVQELAQFALAYAQAGVDCVAPSDMMDGRVGAIRKILDTQGLDQTLIMSYSAKFQSKFYGPFRVAADSVPRSESPLLKDRATYQIDPAFPQDAYLSSLRDVEEGADILMVKPALPYLDVLAKLSSEIKKPWAVYQVLGECASIEVLAQNGLMDAPAAYREIWTSCVRAGASILITYGARFARSYLESGK